jgi:hypothetical protein
MRLKQASARAAGQTHSSCHRSKKLTLPAAALLAREKWPEDSWTQKNHHPGPLVAGKDTPHCCCPAAARKELHIAAAPDAPCMMNPAALTQCVSATRWLCVGVWVLVDHRVEATPTTQACMAVGNTAVRRANLSNKHAQPAALRSSRQPVHGPPAVPMRPAVKGVHADP